MNNGAGLTSTDNTSFLCPDAPEKMNTHTPLSTFHRRHDSSLEALRSKCGAHGCARTSLTLPPCPLKSRNTDARVRPGAFVPSPTLFPRALTSSTRTTPDCPATASRSSPVEASHHAHAKYSSSALSSANARSSATPPSSSRRYTDARFAPTVANRSA